MATFTVKFDTDNAAFEGASRDYEIARILRAIADKVEDKGCSGFFETIRDVNGNDVGRYAMLKGQNNGNPHSRAYGQAVDKITDDEHSSLCEEYKASLTEKEKSEIPQ